MINIKKREIRFYPKMHFQHAREIEELLLKLNDNISNTNLQKQMLLLLPSGFLLKQNKQSGKWYIIDHCKIKYVEEVLIQI